MDYDSALSFVVFAIVDKISTADYILKPKFAFNQLIRGITHLMPADILMLSGGLIGAITAGFVIRNLRRSGYSMFRGEQMNNEIKAHIASYMCFLPSQISQLKPYIDNDIFNDIKTVYPLHSNEIIIREINGKHYTLIPCGNLKHYQFSDVRKLMHKINTLHSIHVEVSVDFTLLSHYLDNELVSMISELIQKKQKKEVIKAETMLYDAAVYHHKAFEIERYFPLSYDKIEHVEEVIGDNERLYIIISQPESALYHVELKHEDMIKIVYQSDTQLATRIAYNNRLLEIDAPVPYAIIYDALSYAKQYRKSP